MSHLFKTLLQSPGSKSQIPTDTCGSHGPGIRALVTQEHKPYLEGQGQQTNGRFHLKKIQICDFTS